LGVNPPRVSIQAQTGVVMGRAEWYKDSMKRNEPSESPGSFGSPEVPVEQARRRLAGVVHRVQYGRERITLTVRGIAVAAIVPIDATSLTTAAPDDVPLIRAKRPSKGAQVPR